MWVLGKKSFARAARYFNCWIIYLPPTSIFSKHSILKIHSFRNLLPEGLSLKCKHNLTVLLHVTWWGWRCRNILWVPCAISSPLSFAAQGRLWDSSLLPSQRTSILFQSLFFICHISQDLSSEIETLFLSGKNYVKVLSPFLPLSLFPYANYFLFN